MADIVTLFPGKESSLNADGVNEVLVGHLKEMLERAERGDIIAAAFALVGPEKISTGWTGANGCFDRICSGALTLNWRLGEAS